MSDVAVAFAYALLAEDAVDFRPSVPGGDTFTHYKPDAPDTAVIIDVLDAVTEYATSEDDTTLRVTVRGPQGDWAGTRARAYDLYKLVRSWPSAPYTWAATTDAETVVTGVWPEPPTAARVDPNGRVEVLFRVRVAHVIGE